VHTQWEKGDDYAGDPAQEAQGLNGVYVTDTTVEIIRQAVQALNNMSI
jgi:mannan endo-1,4-beta-mannosidase